MTHIRIDDVPTEETLRELIAFERGPAVSLLLPTKPRPLEGVPEATTRLKSLLQEAKAALEQADSPDEKAIDAQLAPARALLDVRGPWVGAAGGLLLYLGDGFARGVRLPEPVAAGARIGERFHVLPLALALADRERFHVLALSEHDVRLFAGDRESLHRVPLPDVPESVRYEQPMDDRVPEDLQFHSGAGGTSTGGGRRPAIFHGQGKGEGKEDEVRRRFLAAVAHGVRSARSDSEADTPLLLAGVDRLAAAFLDVAGDLRVDPSPVSGPLSRPTPTALAALHAAAWPRVAERAARRRRRELDRARSQAASSGTRDAAAARVAASRGQVDAVWLARDLERRGVTADEIDALVAAVLSHGGKVFPLDDGEEPRSGILATYRFTVGPPPRSVTQGARSEGAMERSGNSTA